jgi:hypothetical protein
MELRILELILFSHRRANTKDKYHAGYPKSQVIWWPEKKSFTRFLLPPGIRPAVQ